jgi:hypothetical protein
MQDALYFFCNLKRHRFMVPNVQVFGWESDLVSVTRDDYVYEYEIKISRKDFLLDLTKHRHSHLTRVHAGESGLWPGVQRGANYLFYAAPESLLTVNEIPSHAGLIVVTDSGLTEVARPAPKLHKHKLPEHSRQWLERSITQRFWSARLKGSQ